MNEALSLLLIGMLTVFVILSLVIVIGNTVIRFTNRYWPQTKFVHYEHDSLEAKAAKAKLMAAIAAAVDVASEGKGHISSIEKKTINDK